MAAARPPRSHGGRSLRWRAWMLAVGVLLAGYGVAVVRWPRVLHWTLAGGFVAVGLVLVISAFLARGRSRAGPQDPPADPEV